MNITKYILILFFFNAYCQVSNETIIDDDGNKYKTTIIGGQEWLKENLNVSKYSDGTIIPQVTDLKKWLRMETGAWCYYENKSSNGIKFGKLYNWYAVAGIYDKSSLLDPKLRKKLAPEGWRIPNNDDLINLISSLDSTFQDAEMHECKTSSIAIGKMIDMNSTNLIYKDNILNNESGFSAIFAGKLNEIEFVYEGKITGWWTFNQSEADINKKNKSILGMNYGEREKFVGICFGENPINGYSVRCIKN